jgi:hypothetical protein
VGGALRVPRCKIDAWPVRPNIVKLAIRVGVTLPLLNASAVAFEKPATRSFIPKFFLQSLEYCQAKDVSSCRKTPGAQVEGVKIIESDFAELSGFSSRGDESRYPLYASNRSRQELFMSPNPSNDSGGAKVRFGSLWVSTRYENTPNDGNTNTFGLGIPTQTRQDQTIGFDLTPFSKSGDSIIWALAPSAIYVSSSTSETYQTLAGSSTDRTTGLTAGATWARTNGSASLSYWNYYSDSRIGQASYDAAGRGVDFNIGAYAGTIGFYTGLSYRQTEDLSLFTRSVNQGYDAYVSLSYKPRYLPDVVVDGAVGRYDYNGLAFGTTSDGTYWSGTLGFDFSKFLWSPVPNPKLSTKDINSGLPSVKLFYQYYNETSHTGVWTTPRTNQFIGAMFRASLN